MEVEFKRGDSSCISKIFCSKRRVSFFARFSTLSESVYTPIRAGLIKGLLDTIIAIEKSHFVTTQNQLFSEEVFKSETIQCLIVATRPYPIFSRQWKTNPLQFLKNNSALICIFRKDFRTCRL